MEFANGMIYADVLIAVVLGALVGEIYVLQLCLLR
jgi:hypothetical protein